MKKLLVAAAAVLVLAGCTATAPVAQPTLSASSASPSPSEAPEPTVEEIVVTATGFEVRDADGQPIHVIDWADDEQDALALMTEVFGEEPEAVPYAGHIESPPGTDYTWDGFVLRILDAEAPGTRGVDFVIAQKAESLDTPVRTAAGLGVGSTLQEVESAGPYVTIPYEDQQGGSFAWYRIDSVTVGPEEHDFVGLRIDLTGGNAVEIMSPVSDYGV